MLTPEKNPKVAVVGMATVDFLYTMERHPAEDTENKVQRFSSVVGGPAGRGAITAARLGAEVRLMATVGKGPHADLLRGEIAEEGIETTWCQHDGPSQHSAVIVAMEKATRTTLWLGQPKATESDLERLPSFLVGADIALLDGTDEALAAAAIASCKQLNIPVVIDTGSGRTWTESLLNGVDYVIAPEKYFPRWVEMSADDPRALDTSRHENRVVAATRGAGGGVYQVDGEPARASWGAVPVQAVDTCGAGDTFHGAFAWAIAMGLSVHASFQVAAAAAAAKVQQLGNEGLPDVKQLEDLLGCKVSDVALRND